MSEPIENPDAPVEAAESDVSRERAQQLVADGAQLIDVRSDHEWNAGRIPGAVHIPLDELAQRAAELDKDRAVVVYCRGGNRSSMASAALEDGGFDAHKLTGGITGWDEAGQPLEPEGGFVAESGEAAAVLAAQKKAAQG